MTASTPRAIPPPQYTHLFAVTDEIGLFEPANLTARRSERWYRVDNAARGLVVLCRADSSETGPTVASSPADVASSPGEDATGDSIGRRAQLAWAYLRFVRQAQRPDGRVADRRDPTGAWHGEPGVAESWGCALLGLGTATPRARDPELTHLALEGFHLSAGLRSSSPQVMALAGLGAAEVLRVRSGDQIARSLLADAAEAVFGAGADDPAWPWPQPRLTRVNAVIPDLLMAAGDALGDAELVRHGIALLGWLLQVQITADHLSVVPTAGWAAGEPRPGFDQHPIEVSTLADACARAYELTGEERWSHAVELAAAWFYGFNDTGTPLADQDTGGCSDRLQAHGRDQNPSTESTLALISTQQHAHRLVPVR